MIEGKGIRAFVGRGDGERTDEGGGSWGRRHGWRRSYQERSAGVVWGGRYWLGGYGFGTEGCRVSSAAQGSAEVMVGGQE